MTRERFAWLFCMIAVVVLSVQLSSVSREAPVRDDDYTFVRTLVDVQRQVASNYVRPTDPAQLRQAAIDGMLTELDPFTMYVPPQQQESFDRMLEGTFQGVGVTLNQLDNGDIEVVSPVDGSPAFKAGVMAGDVIIKVNGESVAGMRIPDVAKKVTGPVGTDVTLTVRRLDGQTHDLTMTRAEVVILTARGWGRNEDNTWNWFIAPESKVAYLRVTQFTPDTFDATKSAVEQMLQQGMKGLVMDLRFNPGGRLDQALRVIDLFLDKGVMLSTKGENRPEQVVNATPDGTLPHFPLIILVNESSASASEVVAGSLMDNKRALVIGQRTYGKGSVQELIPLEQNAGELKMTVAYYYLPSGRLVHREKDSSDWGVQPNIVVELDEEAQLALQRQRYEAELFRRPTTQPSTDSTTQPAAPPPLDPQLQRAVDTMKALLVLGDGHAKKD
jgi:carboxyl-terminal processing protease